MVHPVSDIPRSMVIIFIADMIDEKIMTPKNVNWVNMIIVFDTETQTQALSWVRSSNAGKWVNPV